MRHRASVAPALLLAATLAFGSMFAANSAAGEPSAADMETARTLFQQASDLRDKGDVRGALTKFKAANALAHTPITGVELGRTHAMLNELVEAREAFLSVGRLPIKAGQSQNAAEARAESEKLAQQLEHRIPSLNLVVRGVPDKVAPTISVDGADVSIDALGEPYKVNPGKHTIFARAGSLPEQRADVEVVERETKTVRLDLGGSTEPIVDPKAKPTTEVKTTTNPLVYVGVAAAAVGGVVGLITGIASFAKASTLKGECPDKRCTTSDQESDLDGGKRLGTISNLSFAVAVAGGVVAVIGILNPKVLSISSHETNKQSRVRPWIGLGSAGVTGSF